MNPLQNPDENSKISGKYFVIIKNSSYLKMVKKYYFFIMIFFDNKYMHYGIFSWNHVVDIISAEEPKIAKLENHTEE